MTAAVLFKARLLSVVSTALRVTDWATVSVTAKAVCPFGPVEAGEGPVMVAAHGEGAQFVAVNVTALPATGTEPVPRSVTVTVD